MAGSFELDLEGGEPQVQSPSSFVKEDKYPPIFTPEAGPTETPEPQAVHSTTHNNPGSTLLSN